MTTIKSTMFFVKVKSNIADNIIQKANELLGLPNQYATTYAIKVPTLDGRNYWVPIENCLINGITYNTNKHVSGLINGITHYTPDEFMADRPSGI